MCIGAIPKPYARTRTAYQNEDMPVSGNPAFCKGKRDLPSASPMIPLRLINESSSDNLSDRLPSILNDHVWGEPQKKCHTKSSSKLESGCFTMEKLRDPHKCPD